MILKSQVEWTLHCCVVLAGLPPGRYLSTKALAELHGVPKEYLSKALQALSQARLVEATLGPSGGYRLARPGSEISFLDIVEAVEGRSNTFACNEIRANSPCWPPGHRASRPCAIARVMWRADEAWRDTLRAVKVSDVAESLAEDVPPALLQSTYEWVLNRAG
ncbi:Rrf2 family transcriptional regulator [Bordetella petrii]|nr:Rrf2 family transcriptional regulator [Bordetella petrii]